MQKWEAMRELAIFIHQERPDIANNTFMALAFWTFSGVSAIPALNGKDNYWTAYTKNILKHPLELTNQKEEATELPSKAWVTYFSTPLGAPVVVLLETQKNISSDIVTIIASKPINGILTYKYFNGDISSQIIHLNFLDWVCNSACSIKITSEYKVNTESHW